MSCNITVRIENRVSAVQAVSNKCFHWSALFQQPYCAAHSSGLHGEGADAHDAAIPAQEQNVRGNNQVINCFRFSVDWLKWYAWHISIGSGDG